MFFCLCCNEFHEDDSIAEKLFQSGYRLVEDTKVPLGICQQEKDYVEIIH